MINNFIMIDKNKLSDYSMHYVIEAMVAKGFVKSELEYNKKLLGVAVLYTDNDELKDRLKGIDCSLENISLDKLIELFGILYGFMKQYPQTKIYEGVSK